MTTKIFFIAIAALGFLCDKKDESTAADAAPEAAAPVQSATADVDAAASATPITTHHTVVPTKASASAAPTGTVNVSCPSSTQVAFAGAGGAKVCHVSCNTNTDCSKNAPGTKCAGSGQVLAPDGSHSNVMKFCQ
jgi:hypothetical protein